VDTADVAVTLAGNVADLETPDQDEFVGRVQKGENPPAALREILRRIQRAQVAKTRAETPRQIDDPYDVIVIDPPWPMEKIERDLRPMQGEVDYPTMTIDEIKAMNLPATDDCHLWLWTTHRFLPDALVILEAWAFRYVCAFVWHKPGGFQPVGLPQYNCEFALYARKGTPKFIDTQAFNVCFNAPRTEHSAKPEAFYEIVRRVTVGDRLDMFNRRPIEGFDTWGKGAK